MHDVWAETKESTLMSLGHRRYIGYLPGKIPALLWDIGALRALELRQDAHSPTTEATRHGLGPSKCPKSFDVMRRAVERIMIGRSGFLFAP